MPLPRVGSLDVAEDPDFERRGWRVQRIGWAVMGLLVLAGLGGVFGSGPLSSATAALPGGVLTLEYQRFARRQAPTRLKVSFVPPAEGGEVRLWLDARYAEKVKLESVVPQPLRVELGRERLSYVFATRPGAQRASVSFKLQFERFGLMPGRVGVAGGELGFRQVVYP